VLVKGTSVQVELSGGTSPLSPLVRLQGFIGGFYWPGPHIVDFGFWPKPLRPHVADFQLLATMIVC
jgi:hypothetical protein